MNADPCRSGSGSTALVEPLLRTVSQTVLNPLLRTVPQTLLNPFMRIVPQTYFKNPIFVSVSGWEEVCTISGRLLLLCAEEVSVERAATDQPGGLDPLQACGQPQPRQGGAPAHVQTAG